MTSYTTR
ncbi:Protein CBG27551 [Caenorhabditis briggsae]|nr:Protein CBG27551 [Caenorhabditis briggsae]CAS00445.1 Protein CBG27551 [Caenorhabditis briggsae]